MTPLDDWMTVEKIDNGALYDPLLQDFNYRITKVGPDVKDMNEGDIIACPAYVVQEHGEHRLVKREDVFGVVHG